MKTKQELVKEWLKRAEKDLLTATHEFSFDKEIRWYNIIPTRVE